MALERGNLDENQNCSTSIKHGRVMISMPRFVRTFTGKREILILSFFSSMMEARKDLNKEYREVRVKKKEQKCPRDNAGIASTEFHGCGLPMGAKPK